MFITIFHSISLERLEKQISLFNVFFDRLSILTKSVDYNNCDIIVFDDYPFDIEIKRLENRALKTY